MKFCIANCTDKPNRKHVAQIVNQEKGHLEYLSDELRDFGIMRFQSETTDLIDFGFKITYTGTGTYFLFEKVRDSVAKYPNGNIRRWQGQMSFILKAKEEIG